jgi:hypothetical protein
MAVLITVNTVECTVTFHYALYRTPVSREFKTQYNQYPFARDELEIGQHV